MTGRRTILEPILALAMVASVGMAGQKPRDYRGELRVLLVNLGPRPATIRRGDRIAQLVVAPVSRPVWVEVSELPPTARGEGGFGHTGD